jgi:hypothetical protein
MMINDDGLDWITSHDDDDDEDDGDNDELRLPEWPVMRTELRQASDVPCLMIIFLKPTFMNIYIQLMVK